MSSVYHKNAQRRPIFRIRRTMLQDAVCYVFLIAVCCFALIPYLWGFLTSLKPTESIFLFPPEFWPRPATLVHYRDVLMRTNLPLYLRNSLVVTFSAVFLTLFAAFHSAYAVSRFRFKLKPVVMYGTLATSMIPGISILVPLFLLSSRIGLYNHHLALVLTFTAWQTPIAFWLLKGFVDSVPYELEEAAAIEGASLRRILYGIVLPLARPGISAAAIMSFIYIWNDFLIPMTLTTGEEKTLLQVGLFRYYADTTGVSWGRFMAYTMLISLPIVLAFLLLNRRFIEGLTKGSVKG